MPEKLKPCPFCGGEAEYYIEDHMNSDTSQLHKIFCKNVFKCGAEIIDAISTWDRDYKNQVLNLFKRWNRRTPDA